MWIIICIIDDQSSFLLLLPFYSISKLSLLVHPPYILYKQGKIFIFFFFIIFVGDGRSRFEGKSLIRLRCLLFSSFYLHLMGLKVANKSNELHLFFVIKLLQCCGLDFPWRWKSLDDFPHLLVIINFIT